MNVKTKFNIGQKLFTIGYLSNNKISSGKVESIIVEIKPWAKSEMTTHYRIEIWGIMYCILEAFLFPTKKLALKELKKLNKGGK